MPLIMAENDRDVYRRSQAALAREKEIMKDVDGWEVSNDWASGRKERRQANMSDRPARAYTTARTTLLQVSCPISIN